MELKTNKQGKETVVELSGRLDTPASLEIEHQISALESDASGIIVMDCTELSYISSAGLRLFMKLRKISSEKGGSIILKGLREEIKDVFRLVGFLDYFELR